MKRIILYACTLLCFINAIAQEVTDSPVRKDKIGFSVSIWGESVIIGSFMPSGEPELANHPVHSFGMNYVHPLNKFVDFETGVEYSSFPTTDFNAAELYSSSDTYPKRKYGDMNLINIPLTARINCGKYLYLNGGLLLNIDISGKSSAFYSQSGVGTIIGIGGKYDFKSGWEITINPSIKLHSVISFIHSTGTERLWETGWRLGVMMPLK